MSTKHTPGPWIVRGGFSIYAADGKTPVADACLNESVATTDEANARLIAAAPDLLSCLIEMVEVHDEPCHLDHHGCCQSHFLDDVNDGGCRVANARAAIAKATGENK